MAIRCFISCVLLCVGISAGLNLDFHATPSTVTPILTKSLEMRCAVTKGSNTQSDRDTRVTSIVITRLYAANNTNETFAIVTAFDAAHPLFDQSKLEVKGDVKQGESANEIAYINIKWKNPADVVASMYYCSVVTLNLFGQPGTLGARENVGVTAPSLNDVIQYVLVLEKDQKDLQSRLDTLEGTPSSTGNKTSGTYEGRLNSLEQAVFNQSKIQGINGATHIETDNFTYNPNTNSQRVSGQFAVPFKKEPEVVVALDGFESHSNDVRVRITPSATTTNWHIDVNSSVYVTGHVIAFEGQ